MNEGSGTRHRRWLTIGGSALRLVRRSAFTVFAASVVLAIAACADSRGADPSTLPEHAVLIHISAPKDGSDQIGLDQIEDPLIAVLESSGAGEWDGHETDLTTGEAVIYLYGPDADRLYAAIEPTLRELPIPPGSYAIKQYGEPGARESRVELHETGS